MGIYVHIPFCASKCFYCGFYSSVNIKTRKDYIEALKKEIEIRSNYLGTKESKTLYFGGGTPSIIDIEEMNEIIQHIKKYHSISKDAEITIEANPDDISEEKIKGWRSLGFNRISIGIQSFSNKILKEIGRTHTKEEALNAIYKAKNGGFDNICIDIIVGLPQQNTEDIENDLQIISELPISHISVYMLSIDEGSIFNIMNKRGRLILPKEEDVLKRYEYVCKQLVEYGFTRYEISNFAKNDMYSQHNISYWRGIPYLGLGPSAHSFDGKSRQWNVSNTTKYITAIKNGLDFFEKEYLESKDVYNEYLMTRLRMKEGINLTDLKIQFPDRYLKFCNKITGYIESEDMEKVADNIGMTFKGWLISDYIYSDLFEI